MSLTVAGIPGLRKRLHAIDKVSGRPLLRTIQLDATANAKRAVPVKTGNLRRTIRPGGLTETFTIVKATAGYAAYVELGTRPHVIRPKNGKVLAWPAKGSARLSGSTKRGGSRIFARVVHHPGTKPQPFLVPGAQQAIEDNLGVKAIVAAWNKAA